MNTWISFGYSDVFLELSSKDEGRKMNIIVKRCLGGMERAKVLPLPRMRAEREGNQQYHKSLCAPQGHLSDGKFPLWAK